MVRVILHRGILIVVVVAVGVEHQQWSRRCPETSTVVERHAAAPKACISACVMLILLSPRQVHESPARPDRIHLLLQLLGVLIHLVLIEVP